jgi:hypothetical protein
MSPKAKPTVEKCLQTESQPVISWQVFSTPSPEIRHQSWKEGHCVGNNLKKRKVGTSVRIDLLYCI